MRPESSWRRNELLAMVREALAAAGLPDLESDPGPGPGDLAEEIRALQHQVDGFLAQVLRLSKENARLRLDLQSALKGDGHVANPPA